MKPIAKDDEIASETCNMIKNNKSSHSRKKRLRFFTPPFRATSIVVILAILLIFASLFDAVNAAKDYYKIMGVDRKADERTIKRAYRVSYLFITNVVCHRTKKGNLIEFFHSSLSLNRN